MYKHGREHGKHTDRKVHVVTVNKFTLASHCENGNANSTITIGGIKW